MSRKQLCRAACTVVLWSLSAASIASAAVIHGGPTFDGSTGYRSAMLHSKPGSTASSGIGIGYAVKYVAGDYKGSRALRWDAAGAMELGNLGTDSRGKTSSSAYAINDAGTAVGYADTYNINRWTGERAVRWDASGTVATELGNLGSDNLGFTRSFAYAVNNAGTAVGEAGKYVGGTYNTRAVRWDASGTAATELGKVGSYGFTNSAAYAVNDAGMAAGYADKHDAGDNKGPRAVRWDVAGVATELANLGTDSSGYTRNQAWAINDAGTAVGEASKFNADDHKGARAVSWDASGTATELGNLGTDDAGFTTSSAVAINHAGTAVGSADKYVAGDWKGLRAVRWDALGAATELGTLGTQTTGYAWSYACALNDGGTVVGYAFEYDDSGSSLGQRAVMWGLNGIAIDLNALIDPASGWVNLHIAQGISDDNWVTGVGRFDPDRAGPLAAYDRLFLLHVPVPEPGAMGLLTAGALMLMGRRRALVRT